jgi:uncharacterized membrane protein YvbJ
MNCTQCGCELEEGAAVCPNCGTEQGKVRVLAPEERENFAGITIEAGRAGGDSDEYRSEGPGRRIYVRRITIGNSPGGILLWVLIGTVLVLLVLISLPLALIGFGLLLLRWLSGGLRGR